MKNFTAALTAVFISAMPVTMASSADIQDIAPVYQYFNQNDVNGRITIVVPEETKAAMTISFDSPEGEALPYYISELDGGNVYSFDIEGADNIDDDYRRYTLTLEFSGGLYNSAARPYTDKFTIPDGDISPDSFREIRYDFAVDDTESQNDWDITTDTENAKDIALHLDYIRLGDVDNNGIADAADATLVLAEYSRISTGGEVSLSEKEQLCADVNGDKLYDATDASYILVYYSINSTGGSASWDDIIES